MNDKVKQIQVGRFQVGVLGLAEAIAAVRELGELPEAEIAEALYQRLVSQNYIPRSAAAEYKEAFLREYKRALGEPVPEPESGPVIRILGPGCPNCHRLDQLVLELLNELQLPVAVEHIKDLDQISAFGVWATPALLIDREVKVMGQVPPKDTLRQWLVELQRKLAEPA